MPSILSTTPPASSTKTSASPTLDVSPPKDPLVQFLREFGDKIEKSQMVTQNLIFNISKKMEKGKSVDTSYSTKDLAPNSAAPASTFNVEYGMPPNYFARQSPLPCLALTGMAEPVRPVLSTGQTGVVVASPAASTPIVPIVSSAGLS